MKFKTYAFTNILAHWKGFGLCHKNVFIATEVACRIMH